MIIGSSGWLPGHCYVGTKTSERFLCVVTLLCVQS